MKKAKKVVALALCAVLLVVGSVTGTMAYLTSQDEVVNTFTIGQVNITLDEKDTDNDSNKEDNTTIKVNNVEQTRDKANEYHVIPGAVFEKDPVVTVLAGSENSYVRAKVTVTYQAVADTVIPANFFTTWVKGFDSTVWIPVNENQTKKEFKQTINGEEVEFISRTYELRYKDIVDGYDANKQKADERLAAIFTGIEIPGEGLDNAKIATLEGLQIDVKAHAIQADGFTATDDKTAEQVAWDAFDKQMTPVTGN